MSKPGRNEYVSKSAATNMALPMLTSKTVEKSGAVPASILNMR